MVPPQLLGSRTMSNAAFCCADFRAAAILPAFWGI
jgi:hypothetical protein